jgi:hypothetical protein
MALTQPKKPVGGAFGVFASEKRPDFTKACAGQKASAVAKMAGEEWKKISEADKSAYQKKYEMAKTQFEKDMAAFLENGGEKSKGARALRSEKKAMKEGTVKKIRDAEAPKKPAGGAYGRFLAENREEIKKMLPAEHKITDVTKKAGGMWKVLPAPEKEKYEAMYKTAKEKYDEEFAEYKANKKAEEPTEGKSSEEATEQNTSKKRNLGRGKSATPEKSARPVKRGRAVATPMSVGKHGVHLDETILGKASTAGVESQLRNLAMRPDVVASGKGSEELLKALEVSGGFVQQARRALCGA